MDRQARSDDRVLVKSGEMTGRSQRMPRCLGGGGGGREGVYTTEIKIHLPRWARNLITLHPFLFFNKSGPCDENLGSNILSLS